MDVHYKVLVLLTVFSTEIAVERVSGATTFYCHGDICNKGKNDQFCSEIYKLCRDCEDVRMDCGTDNQPDKCFNYCFDYKIKLSLERQKSANCSDLDTNFQSIANISQTEYKQGDNITVDCSPGYEPLYTNTAQCGEYGLFKILSPTCTVQTCVLSPLIANAKFTPSLDSRARTNMNTTINVECEDGFTLIGSNTMTCLANNTWNVDAPFCIPSLYIWWPRIVILETAVCVTVIVTLLAVSYVWKRCQREYKPKEVTQPPQPKTLEEADNDLEEVIEDEAAAPSTQKGQRDSDYSTSSDVSACSTASNIKHYENKGSNGNITNISTTYNMYGDISQRADRNKQIAANIDDSNSNHEFSEPKRGNSPNKLPTCESQTTTVASQETQKCKADKGTIPFTDENETYIALDEVPLILKKQFEN